MDLLTWEATSANAASNVIGSVLTLLPPGGTFVDVGANVGNVSVAVREHDPEARIYAFEPVAEYRLRCQQRLAPGASGLSWALGDRTEMRRLWCDDKNLGWNTMVEERAEPAMRYIDVPTGTFDAFAYLHHLERLDVVKIDVEGFEYAVLGGMH